MVDNENDASGSNHIVMKESGEGSDYDWRILGVFAEFQEALVFAWKCAFDDWTGSISVHTWDRDVGRSADVTHLSSQKLRRDWVSAELARMSESIDRGIVPEVLARYTGTRPL